MLVFVFSHPVPFSLFTPVQLHYRGCVQLLFLFMGQRFPVPFYPPLAPLGPWKRKGWERNVTSFLSFHSPFVSRMFHPHGDRGTGGALTCNCNQDAAQENTAVLLVYHRATACMLRACSCIGPPVFLSSDITVSVTRKKYLSCFTSTIPRTVRIIWSLI